MCPFLRRKLLFLDTKPTLCPPTSSLCSSCVFFVCVLDPQQQTCFLIFFSFVLFLLTLHFDSELKSLSNDKKCETMSNKEQETTMFLQSQHYHLLGMEKSFFTPEAELRGSEQLIRALPGACCTSYREETLKKVQTSQEKLFILSGLETLWDTPRSGVRERDVWVSLLNLLTPRLDRSRRSVMVCQQRDASRKIKAVSYVKILQFYLHIKAAKYITIN